MPRRTPEVHVCVSSVTPVPSAWCRRGRDTHTREGGGGGGGAGSTKIPEGAVNLGVEEEPEPEPEAAEEVEEAVPEVVWTQATLQQVRLCERPAP